MLHIHTHFRSGLGPPQGGLKLAESDEIIDCRVKEKTTALQRRGCGKDAPGPVLSAAGPLRRPADRQTKKTA
jgi:hypothetical protein